MEPVVCAFLELPPDAQTFLRIRELSEVFVNKLDQLTMVVAASHSANTSPVAVQAVKGLREAAAKHCLDLSGAVFNAYKFATVYLKFVHNLASLEVSQQTFMDIYHIHLDASVEMKKTEAARKAMVQFKQDITDVVSRIQTDLKESNDSKEVFTAENGQAVTELIQATDECDRLLQQIGDYHAAMKFETEDGKEQKIKSYMPSEDEVTMMRERWTNYSTDVKVVDDSFTTVVQKLRSAEGIKRADNSHDNLHNSGEAVPPTSTSNPVEEVDGRNLIAGTEAPGPSHAKPKVSFWRSFISCIYSCLTLKCFR